MKKVNSQLVTSDNMKDNKIKNREKMNKTETSKAIDEWTNWSMTQHEPDEIRHKILTSPQDVCFTYLCRFCKMPVEFIDELVTLSTCLLTTRTYSNYYDKVKMALESKMGLDGCTPNIDSITIIAPDEKEWDFDKCNLIVRTVIKSKLNDRIDWLYITNYQNLTKEFVVKYRDYIRWNILTPHNDITQELIDYYKELYSATYNKTKDKKTKQESDYTYESDFDEEYDFDDLD